MVGFPYGKHNPKAFAHVYTEPSTGLVAHLHIDADITNGARPCDPLDSTATVTVGGTQAVGVCLEDYQPNDVWSFQIGLVNDDGLNFAPDPQGSEEPMNGGTGPDCGNCVDDNPDANDGDSPTGLKLGSGWDCTGFTFVRPRSEVPPIELVCNGDIAAKDFDLSANPGLLATVTFDALAGGVDTLTFASDTAIGMASAQDGSCGDDPEYLIGCFGATIHKVAAPTPTPMPTITPTDTPAHGPVGGIAEFPDIPSASAEEARGPAEGSGWSAGKAAALAGVGAMSALAISAAGWYARRRPRP
jgi:hypothetical protein